MGSINKNEYVARVSGICKASWSRMLAAFARRYPDVARAYRDEATQSKGEGPQFHTVIRRIFLPGLRSQLDEVQAITAPQADQHEIELILGEMRHSIDEASQQPVESAKRFMMIFSHFSTLAWGYGFNPCLVYESDFRETD